MAIFCRMISVTFVKNWMCATWFYFVRINMILNWSLPSLTLLCVSIAVAVFLGQPFLQTLSADKTTITLSWGVPSGSVVTSYVVSWERDSSMVCPYEDEGSITIPTSDESYNTIISGAEEDSRYFVSVTAVNSDENTTSNIATVSTDEDSKFIEWRL